MGAFLRADLAAAASDAANANRLARRAFGLSFSGGLQGGANRSGHSPFQSPRASRLTGTCLTHSHHRPCSARVRLFDGWACKSNVNTTPEKWAAASLEEARANVDTEGGVLQNQVRALTPAARYFRKPLYVARRRSYLLGLKLGDQLGRCAAVLLDSDQRELRRVVGVDRPGRQGARGGRAPL
jgi:hypothetical protein